MFLIDPERFPEGQLGDPPPAAAFVELEPEAGDGPGPRVLRRPRAGETSARRGRSSGPRTRAPVDNSLAGRWSRAHSWPYYGTRWTKPQPRINRLNGNFCFQPRPVAKISQPEGGPMKRHLRPLHQQVLFLTGATSGIALATVRRAFEQGARIILVSRDGEKLRRLHADLPRKGLLLGVRGGRRYRGGGARRRPAPRPRRRSDLRRSVVLGAGALRSRSVRNAPARRSARDGRAQPDPRGADSPAGDARRRRARDPSPGD
jgi:hypothetical protein